MLSAPAAPSIAVRPASDLVDRLLSSCPVAYEELVRAHGPRLLAVASRYLRCRADAEDALQDAFVNVVRFLHRFDRRSAIETWLHRIVVNSSLMILRTRSRKAVVTNASAESFGDKASPVRCEPVVGPGDRIERAEGGQRLMDAIEELPAMQRSAFLLRHRDGLGVHAIAHMFGVSSSTVKNRLHRARASLQGWLLHPQRGAARQSA